MALSRIYNTFCQLLLAPSRSMCLITHGESFSGLPNVLDTLGHTTEQRDEGDVVLLCHDFLREQGTLRWDNQREAGEETLD